MSPRKNVPVIDALPEQYPYRDEGCDVSPSCLGCSLSWCKYDDPVAYHREMREGRDMAVVQARRAEGKSVSELARHFGVSQRTIHRILERAGQVPAAGPENGMVRQTQRKGCSPHPNLPPKTGEEIAVLHHQVATLGESLATTIERSKL